jgi:hypothetical protein
VIEQLGWGYSTQFRPIATGAMAFAQRLGIDLEDFEERDSFDLILDMRKERGRSLAPWKDESRGIFNLIISVTKEWQASWKRDRN